MHPVDIADKALENTEFLLESNIKTFVLEQAGRPVNQSRLCCDCDCPIDPRRLEVLPCALRCIDCAQDHEAVLRFNTKIKQTRGVIENMS